MIFVLFFLLSQVFSIKVPVSSTFSIEYQISSPSTLDITIFSQSQGYVSLGFGSSMFDAQIIVCNYTDLGAYVVDYTSTNQVTPILSSKQFSQLLGFERNSSHTICQFRTQKSVSMGQSVDMIWATGANDNFIFHPAKGNFQFKVDSSANCGVICSECTDSSVCTKCSFANYKLKNGVCEEVFNYDQYVPLSNNFSLFYSIQPYNQIIFTMVAFSKGYISIGLGEKMRPSQLYECNQTNDILMTHSFDLRPKAPNVNPFLDMGNVVDFLGGSRNSTHTICTFKRVMDQNGLKKINLSQPNSFIYAIGSNDSFIRHIERGTVNININKPKDPMAVRIVLNGDFNVFYKFVTTSTIELTITAPTQGWISFGLGSSMFDADILMCNMNNYQWMVTEYKSNSQTKPTLDAKQNVLFVSGFRNATHSSCTFRRDLITDDTTDKKITANTNMDVIFAYGASDVFSIHNFYGSGVVKFESMPSICSNLCSICDFVNNICLKCENSNYMPAGTTCIENLDIETKFSIGNGFDFYSYILNSTHISFTMIVKMLGWVSFGLGKDMNKADIIMCNKSASGQFSTYQLKSTGFIQPILDQKQDVTLIRGARNDSFTECNVIRKMISDDSSDTNIALNQNNDFIFAYGATDDFKIHVFTLYKSLLISNPSSCGSLCQECINNICTKCNFGNFKPYLSSCIENTDVEKHYKLSSTFDLYSYFPDSNTVYFSMVSKVQGWISIGLGKSMSNADIYLCNMDNNQWAIGKYKSKSQTTPSKASIQNLQLIYGTRNSTHTQCGFLRNLKTNDDSDTQINLNQLNDIIFGVADIDTFVKHTVQGYQAINITNTSVVQTCPDECLTCDSDGNCLTCKDPNFIVVEGSCIDNNLDDLPALATVLPNFNMSWDFINNNKTVVMLLSIQNNGYFALGIGKCMKDCDVHSVEFDGNGNVVILDRYSISDNAPMRDDENKDGTNDLKLIGWSNENGLVKVKYVRATFTNDSSYDKGMPPGSLLFSYAFSPNNKGMSYHADNCGRFTLDFIPSYHGGASIATKENLNEIHGWVLFVVWGFLIDIMWMISRYFKTWKFYIEVHGVFMGIGAIVGFILEILVIAKNQDKLENLNNLQELTKAHYIIGVIIMALVVLEMFVGYISKIIIERKISYIEIKYAKYVHLVLGVICYVLGKVNIGIGLKIYAPTLLNGLYGFYAAVLGIRIIAEIIFRLESRVLFPLKRSENFYDNENKKHLVNSDLLDKLSKNWSRKQLLIEFPNLKFVIFNNSVYEITDFRHPGGDFLLSQVNGREIGRFLYGIYNLESLPKFGHQHSIYAINALEKKFIGSYLNNNIAQEGTVWRIESKTPMSESTTLFRFKYEAGKVNSIFDGLEWIGKHFVVCPRNKPKLTRLYTTVFCYAAKNMKIRDNLLRKYELHINSKKENDFKTDFENLDLDKDEDKEKESFISINSQQKNKSLLKSVNNEGSNYLPLCIKNYKTPNGFSNYIHTHFDDEYLISGNYGYGLELSSESSGIHYIFAGGTGILPFLDLFDVMLKNMIQIEVEERHQKLFKNDFKVVVYYSFLNQDEFMGAEIMKRLYFISKDLGKDWFDLTIKFGGSGNKHEGIKTTDKFFNPQFVKDNVDSNASKVFICGPPMMNVGVGQACRGIGITEDKILFV